MEGNKAWYKKYKASDLNFSPYFNSNISLSDKDDISLGFRYQWNWLRAGDMNDHSAYSWGSTGEQETIIKPDHQFALHLGYERLLNEKNSFTIKGGRSFRYPNIDERIGSGFVTATHNFKLSSQKSLDLEFGHKFLGNNLNIVTNFYYMRMLSEIKYDNASFINRNIAKTHRYGIENKIDYEFKNQLVFSNSFSVSQSKYRAGHRRNNDLTGVPAFKNVVDLEYKFSEFFKPKTSLYYQSSQRMINDEENYQVIQPGYYLLDMGFNGNLKGFNYSMMFNNILNRNYYQYAVASTNNYNVYNTYPLEGFNMMFTLNKSF
jgi:iron complex outermembrane receptor protein